MENFYHLTYPAALITNVVSVINYFPIGGTLKTWKYNVNLNQEDLEVTFISVFLCPPQQKLLFVLLSVVLGKRCLSYWWQSVCHSSGFVSGEEGGLPFFVY